MTLFTENQHFLAVFFITTGSIYSIASKKLTLSGALIGALLASIIYFFAGYTGLAMLTAFFIMGALATSWGSDKKQKIISTVNHQTKRNAGQVLANAAIPALSGVLIFLYPAHTLLFQLMIAASLAAATADTLSSELGNVYGRYFVNILSLKAESRGLDGVVSLEGTLFGVIGAVIIATIHAIGYGLSSAFWIVLSAGIAGNLVDSLLGAAFERKGLLNNNLVNFFNTMSAALISALIFYIIIYI